ncbi:hypothetical protein [Nostoc sp.]
MMINPVIVCLVGLSVYEALAQSAYRRRCLRRASLREATPTPTFYSKKSRKKEHIQVLVSFH